MKTPSPDLFVSPLTHAPFKTTPAYWTESAAASQFPLIDGIPWLTPDPQRTLADWQNRSGTLLAHLTETIASMKEDLGEQGLHELTRQRLEKTRRIQIHHLEFLKDLLAPLNIKGKMRAAEASGLGYRLPANQGLLGYFPNLVRDWGPETGENQAALRILETALDSHSLGRLVVLGAGGCRLAYDLHQSGRPSETICLDINPVLLLTARRILAGNTVRLAEMPVAPKDLSSFGAIRECRVPRTPREGLHLVFGDCYHLPMADGSADSVLSPWLIDILPRPLSELCAEISRVLKPGGQWLNTGSLNFQLRRRADCLSLEETRAVMEDAGFSLEILRQDELPYLRSDLSCHGRLETVTTFRARKVREVRRSVAVDTRPSWLSNPALPIPTSQILQANQVVFEVQAITLSLVDGRRSLNDIAVEIGSRYGLSRDNALEAVTNFFMRNVEDPLFQQ